MTNSISTDNVPVPPNPPSTPALQKSAISGPQGTPPEDFRKITEPSTKRALAKLREGGQGSPKESALEGELDTSMKRAAASLMHQDLTSTEGESKGSDLGLKNLKKPSVAGDLPSQNPANLHSRSVNDLPPQTTAALAQTYVPYSQAYLQPLDPAPIQASSVSYLAEIGPIAAAEGAQATGKHDLSHSPGDPHKGPYALHEGREFSLKTPPNTSQRPPATVPSSPFSMTSEQNAPPTAETPPPDAGNQSTAQLQQLSTATPSASGDFGDDGAHRSNAADLQRVRTPEVGNSQTLKTADSQRERTSGDSNSQISNAAVPQRSINAPISTPENRLGLGSDLAPRSSDPAYATSAGPALGSETRRAPTSDAPPRSSAPSYPFTPTSAATAPLGVSSTPIYDQLAPASTPLNPVSSRTSNQPPSNFAPRQSANPSGGVSTTPAPVGVSTSPIYDQLAPTSTPLNPVSSRTSNQPPSNFAPRQSANPSGGVSTTSAPVGSPPPFRADLSEQNPADRAHGARKEVGAKLGRLEQDETQDERAKSPESPTGVAGAQFAALEANSSAGPAQVQQPTAAERVETAQQIIAQMVDQISQVRSTDRTETTVTLSQPPQFRGVQLIVTELDSARKELNLTFANVQSPEAQKWLAENRNIRTLNSSLSDLGFVVHQVDVTHLQDMRVVSQDPSSFGQQSGQPDRDSQGQRQQQGERPRYFAQDEANPET